MVSGNKSSSFVSLVLLGKYIKPSEMHQILDDCYVYLDRNYIDYELVVVHERSIQNANFNWAPILTTIPSIRVIEVSFELDKEVAWTVGLDNSIGDYVLLYDPQQDPIEVIAPSIEKCQGEFDIVIGVESKPDYSFVYRLVRPLVSKVLKEVGHTVPRNATSFRCLTRQAVNVVTRARNCHHQIYVRISQCGLPSTTVEYQCPPEANHQKRVGSSLQEMMGLLVFNSVKPLRLMSFCGVMGSLFSFFFALYSFMSKLFNDQIADGWTSIVILTSFLFMLLFMILSFFGEYLARLLDEQSRHEPYWVIGEQSSSVMLNEDRYNVLESSI